MGPKQLTDKERERQSNKQSDKHIDNTQIKSKKDRR